MSRFFINRPIFATVIAILIVSAGLMTLNFLPIEQYPDITPPTIQVVAYYPGADSKTISDAVAQPIEQQVNGVEGMIYMSSVCSNSGSYALTISFEVGTDINMANVLVQNRISLALPSLPEEVKQMGVITLKKSTNIIMAVALASKEETYDNLYITNYANLRVFDEIKRIDGVGDVNVIGAGDYSMRIWLDPARMQARNLTVVDIASALNEQNIQVAAGQIGGSPAAPGTAYQYTLTTRGRLSDTSEFKQIIIRKDLMGRVTYLRDVARIELGSKDYAEIGKINGKDATIILIYQLPGSNALEVAKRVKEKMDELATSFPKGLEYSTVFDTTKFVTASIHEVYETLWIAILLVILVIFLFLQDFRATIIPAITIPVSLIGTFAVMSVLGFSINMLTLFGIILAIGIVVDDAIVVVENTARHLESGMKDRKQAAIDAMKEVTGPIVGTTLVLLAVFIPTAFTGGTTGQLFKQFALTIAASTTISALNALSLSPALCALFLRPPKEKKNWFFRGFNKGFSVAEKGYSSLVLKILRTAFIAMIIYVFLVVLSVFGLMKYPSSFVPDEDQGYFMVHVQLPDASSLDRTQAVVSKIDRIIETTPGADNWFTLLGFSLMDGTLTSNNATIFVILKDYDERQADSLKAQHIIDRIRDRFTAEIPESFILPFSPPAIKGLGIAAGFSFILQNKGGLGPQEMDRLTNELVTEGNARKELTYLSSTYRASVPQLYLKIDREKVKLLQLNLQDVFIALQAYLGSLYVNDFNIYGRIFQVKMMAGADARSDVSDILKLRVRNQKGQMVSLGSFIEIKRVFGPSSIARYNMYPSSTINGYANIGYSSGQSMKVMEEIATGKMTSDTGYEWTGMSYQEKQSGSKANTIFILAIALVVLVLAAQYESWKDPFAVIMSVPFAIMGALLAIMIRGMPLSLYTQIGLVLLVALASKNAILIVEFARDSMKEGMNSMDAAIHAARLRFRPILMTSFAFILGVWPLVIATGAASASRQFLGTAVFGGMLFTTMIAIFFVPLFFKVFHSKK